MVAKRIIPCLDVKDGVVVKGINFEGLKEVGGAVEMGVKYSADGADELVYLDISATQEGRHTFAGLVEKIALGINIPFTVGGGISTLDDASRLLDAGADKISINSSAIADPTLISRIAAKYGSQFVVVAIDAKRVCCERQRSAANLPRGGAGGEDAFGPAARWTCTTHGGKKLTDIELFSWAKEAQERGAGEILFTSMDHDGTKAGYACDVYAKMHELLTIPVIASGGAGSIKDIEDVLTVGKADAALAASIFHYNQIPVPELKKALAASNINVRL